MFFDTKHFSQKVVSMVTVSASGIGLLVLDVGTRAARTAYACYYGARCGRRAGAFRSCAIG